MSDSIISNVKECYFCGSQYGLERHHCIKGNANRRLAEEDGLWINLCRFHHSKLHGKDGHEMDMALKKLAEWAWLEQRHYIHRGIPTDEGIEAWIKRYGKNYLGGD